MFLTVAIRTLDRAESLRRTLDSLGAMRLPGDVGWEIVVVDNGSTDPTDDVIRAFAGRLPVRREIEPRRGHAHASNRAVDAARGDYIVWTDDDVVVDPSWLAAYAEAFRRWPDAAVFGGPIVPRYVPPVPRWILECEGLVGGAFGARDFTDAIFLASTPPESLPAGANFALRAAEQRAFRYNPDLGHRPGQRRLGEETDVILRILRSGAAGYAVPAARVEHCVRADMQTTAFVARRAASWGETQPFFEGATRDEAQWFGAPRWLWRRFVGEWASYQIHRRISPAPVWVRHLRDCGLAWGAIRYWKSQKG